MRRSDKTQNQAEAAQVSEECGTKGQAEGQLCSCVQGCFRDTRKFLLGQEGDAAAASVTRDVGLLAPSGRQGPKDGERTFEEPPCGGRLRVSVGVVTGNECGHLNNRGPHSAIGGGTNRQRHV